MRSGKKHLLITGSRGRGKSTLVSRLAPLLSPQYPMGGITTWAVPGEGVWLREDVTGKTAQIGVYDREAGKMTAHTQGFETLGLAALGRCARREAPWVRLDEVGYLEQASGAYQRALLALMERKRLLAVVRKQDEAFLNCLRRREDACVIDLDAPLRPMGCVIMASGLGSRFGGNKLLARLDGRPLLDWVMDATQGVFARPVVVTRHREVEEWCVQNHMPVVLHDLPGRNDTVRLGLEALGDDLAGCLFCAGDQPLLAPDSVLALALAASQEPDTIWRLAYEGEGGTPVLFPRWAFSELKHLPHGAGGSALLRKYPQRVRAIPVRNQRELWDVDRPDDLARLQGLLDEGRGR